MIINKKARDNVDIFEEERDKIIVTYAADNMLKSKPELSQAHRVRSVMQNYYLFKKGAYEIKDGKIHVNIENVVAGAFDMLKEIIYEYERDE